MAANSTTTTPLGRDYTLMKGVKVVMTSSIGFMQIAAVIIQGGDEIPIEYNLAAALLVVLAALVFISTSMLPGTVRASNTLAIANVLDQLGIFLGVTAMFFTFSIFLPPFIFIAIVYWGAYLVMVISTSICCSYNKIYPPAQASTSGVELV